MSSFRERYLEAFTDTISQILQNTATSGAELTQTHIILLRTYKKELLAYEKKPEHLKIIDTINAILTPVFGGDK